MMRLAGPRGAEVSASAAVGAARPAGAARGERPILVTGSHRSGTTWVATMLALAPGTFLVPKEPFNPNPRDYGLDGLARHWFAYAPGLPQDAAARAYRRVLHGRTVRVLRRRRLVPDAMRYLRPWSRPRLVVHDPTAALSSEWLARRFDMAVLVLVRHPAAFAASLCRMGWDFDFANLVDQELLLRDHLAEFEDELRRPPADLVGRAALLWCCLYTVLLRFADRNPDWVLRTHESLSHDPLVGFGDLYRRLGLRWTRGVETGIREHTAPSNPVRAPEGVTHQLRRNSAANVRVWTKLLTPAEVHAVRVRTEELAARFYSDEDWSQG